ncbi:ribonuclease H [Fusarium denticulatum]|uniref:Ribonuclease H n=1 Tax=Fusarium denticulatum TaxID=48507 RepID=A0A8H5TGL0_9HYPO|nr:ribonuclease H [Fusarium denticulatum]
MFDIAEFVSMTLWRSYLYCLNHTCKHENTQKGTARMDYSNMPAIYHHLELMREGKIEQMGMQSDSSKNFTSTLTTSVYTNTSRILCIIPPSICSNFVAELAAAMRDFVISISNTHDVNMHEDMNPHNIMLAAHNDR